MSSDGIKPPAVWKKAANTTTNTNRNGKTEETAASARIPKQNSGTTTATIRTRSPRKMKTQIAKLVYEPSSAASSLSKSNVDVVMNENEKPVVVEEFQKKRQDRDREVKEIQEMLNEITNTPTKQKKPEEEERRNEIATTTTTTKVSPTAKELSTNTFQRSKTDTNLRRPTARKSQARLESQTARSKSAQIQQKEQSPPKQRQKTYNSEEAQRYMLEQKKKRRSLQAAVQDAKPTIDKNEIKKRLADLRQSTRKIVDKNVQIAKKKAVTGEEKSIPSREEKSIPHREEKSIPRREEIRSAPEKQSKFPFVNRKPEAWPDREPKVKSPVKQKDPSPPLSENYKKIGLLRKPEFKDHSFSAIQDFNMDKENLVLEMLTPQILDNPKSRLKDIFKEEKADTSNDKNLEEKPQESISSDSSLKRKSSELDLKIPEAKLRSRTSVREKSVQVDTPIVNSSKTQQKNTELPYWLKPTSVQAYPYNFIMAVRKKLEAIANPPAVASSSSSSLENQAKKTADTPVSYPKNNRNNNVKRRIIDNIDNSQFIPIEKSSTNKENLTEHRLAESLSEVTSNFSSISIQLPDSQYTVSSLKPKTLIKEKKPLRFDEDDDTTVSSSIFSSPEKKRNVNGKSKNSPSEALSPLAMDNISNLQIKSKSVVSNITMGRGDTFVEASASHHRTATGAISHRSDSSVDFSQLLDDFNRSLSQVIEVNHQLKTSLVKSQQIFSPEKQKNLITTTHPVELAEYVSDFEESSNAEEKQAKLSDRTLTNSSIPEVKTPSHKSSEMNSQKSSSGASSTEEAQQNKKSHSSIEEIQSMDKSVVSLETQTFIVSSEEQRQSTSSKTQTIYEEAIEESPNKENTSANQYSLDSLETSGQEDYIKSHINTSRGEYHGERSELSAGPPPSYKASSESQVRTSSNVLNSSMDSEFVRVFNKSDFEISVLSLNRSLSESTVNYSSIGMYEKLIQSETSKSDHLAALLKMREKALIDRTKGQIAWLEVQKERYKQKGLTLQISAIKKKQRGILLKMEKEREEIKKLLQQAKVQRDDNKLRIPEIRPSSDVSRLQQRRTAIQSSTISQQKQHQHQQQQQQHPNPSARSKSSSAIVRGYELETSRSLEQLLQKREEDLRRRREHVERLMEWHRRLDQEEAEVLQLERVLLDYNNAHLHQLEENVSVQDRNPNKTKMEKKLKEIDRSLKELSSISGAEGSTDAGRAGDFVRTTGSKLNKLWRRLTSQRTEKYQPNKRYKLCKADIEQLYEDAKLAVLHDFGENAGQMEVFLGQTTVSSPQHSTLSIEIPHLNLNMSSGQSEEDMMQGNYSPSAAEEGFAAPSTSSRDDYSDGSASSRKKDTSRHSSSSVLHSLPENDYSSSSSVKGIEKLSVPKRLKTIKHDASVESPPKHKTKTENFKNRASTSDSLLRSSSDSEILSSNARISKGTIFSKKYELSSKDGTISSKASTSSRESDSQTRNTSTLGSAAQMPENSFSSISIPHVTVPPSFTEKDESLTAKNLSHDSKTKKSVLQEPGSDEGKDRSSSLNSIQSNEQFSGPQGSQRSVTELIHTDSDQSNYTSSQVETSALNSSRGTKSVVESTNMHLKSNSIKTDSNVLPDASSSSKTNQISSEDIYNSASSGNNQSSRNVSSVSPESENRLSISMQEYVLNSLMIDKTDGSLISSKRSTERTSQTPQQNLPKDASSSSPLSKTIGTKISSSDPTESQNQHDSSPESALEESISQQEVEKSESRSSTQTKTDPTSANIISQISEASIAEKEFGESIADESRRSSEENATVSILKSLLNSTYNSNATFILDNSNELSPSASESVSDLRSKVLLSSNGGLYLDDWSNAAIDSKITAQSQGDNSIVTETTLQSIKSIDNSTNSKHSNRIDESQSNPNITQTQDAVNSSDRTDRNTQNYSSEFEESTNSNQIRSSVIMSTKSPLSQVIEHQSEPETSLFFESDFAESEETNIDDLSLPKFETTGEDDPLNESQASPENTTDLEKRLIDLDVSLKDLDATFEKALSPEKTPSPTRDDVEKKPQQQNDSALMPDIISEAELRRRHQAMLDNEMKQFEHAVPYMYVREIPNKPPPPYVPPAHGSPMTTIFPSEERIKDITYRRTKELYHEILNIDTKDENGKKPPSVLDENITNIYERIILDICKEYLTDYKPILASADPNNFHSPLAFFNPPDRMRCMQDFIYKEVRKSLAMDKNVPKRNQGYSVYGHRGKRDHIGEIIIQEMYEEDEMWSNFYVEEEEVLELIIDEIVGVAIRDIATAVLAEEISSEISPMATEESAEIRCNNST